jgi:hypothetical protein
MTSPASRDPRQWLVKYVSLQQSVDRKIVAALNRADRDAAARIRAIKGKTNISAKVERAQLTEVRIAVQRVLAEMWQSVGETTKASQALAAATALEQGWDWDQVLLRRAFSDASDRKAMLASLKQTASRNVEASVARMTGVHVPLSQRVYRARDLSQGRVDARINSGLARGISWGQLANEVKGFISPNVVGGVSYAAKRLARTEINNAYHAVTAINNQDKPWNVAMVWKTSGSHPEPDICDLRAQNSPYPLDDVPKKPHPQCLCYVYPETVSSEEFLRQYRAGAYNDYLQRVYGQAA